MRIIIPFVFEQLKQAVSEKSGIAVTSPSDCKLLASYISRSTHKQISDTTLKRIYGFAKSTFLPSLYTLNLLAEYCGFRSWDQFSDQVQTRPATGSEKPAAEASAHSTVSLSRKISLNTLQALKNRSVIPYNLTVQRRFINEHLEMFMSGAETATVLTSPAGYGKTIGLCHWVEQQLTQNINEQNDNILLFFSGNIFNGLAYGENLNHWLYSLLGLPADNNALAGVGLEKCSPICLVIDGFDTETLKPEQFEYLFNMLLDVIAVNSNNPDFKVIITMRSASWINCSKRLQIENRLSKWFLGFMQGGNNENNMQTFTPRELDEICRKVNPGQSVDKVNDQMMGFFSYPLFLQYYYQKNHSRFCLADMDLLGIYEVISSYILDKVYSSRYATEKILLITTLLEKGHYIGGRLRVDKLRIFDELKVFNNAYEDMVSIGFIQELNHSNENEFEEYIEFTHQAFLTYCLAGKLIYDNGERYDRRLIDTINDTINPELRLAVLEWCIFNATKVHQSGILDHVTGLELSTSNKAGLLKFLSDLIQRGYLSAGKKHDIDRYFDQERPELFYYFFGVEFISSDYELALQELLKLNLREESQIWLHACLAVINITKLNITGIEKAIAALKRFPDEYFHAFEINPLYCIESIYSSFKFGKARYEALAQITHFMFSLPTAKKSGQVGSNTMLYLLALHTMETGCSPQKTLRFITALRKQANRHQLNYPNFDFFLNLAQARAYFNLGMGDKAIRIHTQLQREYQADKSRFTPYMKSVLDMLTNRMLMFQNKREEAVAMLDHIDRVCDKYGYSLISVTALGVYIERADFMPDSEDDKRLYYKFIKKVRSSGFAPENFLLEARLRHHVVQRS